MLRRALMADAERLGELGAASFVAKFGHLYAAADCAAYVEAWYGTAATAGLLADPALATWVIEEDRALVAFAMLGPCKLPHRDVTAGCIELRRLYTAPGATGRGLGGRLMRATVIPASEAAEAAGAHAWLGVYADNPGAIRFYRRYGFVRVGEYLLPVGATVDREFILRRDARAVVATSDQAALICDAAQGIE